MKTFKKENKTGKIGVFVGRFCPVHLEHEQTIRKMIERFSIKNCLLVVGSINNPLFLRNIFSYRERRNFILKVFPKIKIISLADFFNIKDWLLALDDLLKTIFPEHKKDDFIFFGGSKKDIRYFIENGRQTQIISRFDKNNGVKNISATAIRDYLAKGRPINGLVNPLIIKDIHRIFRKKWEILKNK